MATNKTPATDALPKPAGTLEDPFKPLAAINSLRGMKDALNKELISKDDLIMVAPLLIEEEENWNARGAFLGEEYWSLPHVVKHIRGIADSYIAGRQVPPMTVAVRDGKIVLRDGSCRRRALRLAISEGAQFKKIAVIKAIGDDADQLAFTEHSNNTLPLEPLEKAALYGRYVNGWGWTIQQVAEKTGLNYETIRITLEFLELPLELKQLVQRHVVKAYYAQKLYAEHGLAKALELIKLGQAESKSKTVTPRNVKKATGATPPKPGKKLVEAMRVGLTSITNSLPDLAISDARDFTLKISREQVEELYALREQLAALNKPEEPNEEDANKDQQKLPL